MNVIILHKLPVSSCNYYYFFLLKNIYLTNKFVDQGYKTEKLLKISLIDNNYRTAFFYSHKTAF